LATLPAERNREALNLLAQAEFAGHEFDAARGHAQVLVQLEPDKAYPYQILGDALLELGDYAAAESAYRQMQERGGVQEITQAATAQRLGKMALLRGDLAAAQRSFTQALGLALAQPDPPRETVAWCRWQLGETAFLRGDYAVAERHYRDALTTFPGYFRAVASLGRVRAARGDLADAIAQYEAAVKILPDPSFVAALGDLYLLSGRERDAARQYDLVEAIARLSAAGGALYNRQQALFYADHGRQPEKAYAMAAREYEVRRDIYGADAVAWTALKAGRVDEAQAMIKVALRLGTQDARLFYHAAMIAHAASDAAAARGFLDRALALSPGFDPLQSSMARKIAAASTSPAAPAAPGATPNAIAAVRP
jgi:tetratricopeptide (TPR) repeat protein